MREDTYMAHRIELIYSPVTSWEQLEPGHLWVTQEQDIVYDTAIKVIQLHIPFPLHCL